MWLTGRFANTLYLVKFIIEERLAGDAIIATDFLNRHVFEILCTQQRMIFIHRELPMVRQMSARS